MPVFASTGWTDWSPSNRICGLFLLGMTSGPYLVWPQDFESDEVPVEALDSGLPDQDIPACSWEE
jgi:hypothetical protein